MTWVNRWLLSIIAKGIDTLYLVFAVIAGFQLIFNITHMLGVILLISSNQPISEGVTFGDNDILLLNEQIFQFTSTGVLQLFQTPGLIIRQKLLILLELEPILALIRGSAAVQDKKLIIKMIARVLADRQRVLTHIKL